MACNGSACQSGCYKKGDELAAPEEGGAAAASNSNSNSSSNGSGNNLCVKCKVKEPFTVAGGGGGEDGRFCAECFRSNLFGKFRHAVTSNAMIGPTDNVLVAFSGGPASRVALQFVHELQYKAQKNFDASRDRSLPVFGVGVAFVDESAAHLPSSDKAMDQAIEDVKSLVLELSPPAKELHHFPIESICSGDSSDQREKLKEVLNAVTDATGKEDFLVHLRMLALQKIASENGYTRVVLGSCTSRIACHVISATVKGRGYSLPADIQYVDARWEAPVVLPLHDCLAQELNMLCHLDGLKTIELPYEPQSTINSLISSFVALLQEENPSRESTIVRTAGKLTPFAFNRIPEINDTNVPLATRRRQKRSSLKLNGSISSESFCPMCYSPLIQSKVQALDTPEASKTNSYIFGSSCCSSCRFQILPQDPLCMEHFYSHLPPPLVARASSGNAHDIRSLREHIQDYLLLDSDNEQ
ncbi:hypothetical protein CRG98_047276 [Punica granatum]|uniref:Cytoplasmic tRNA 2-thiolation protein 2 n=1 Tax=Punica granatum TaxID=22663 RepID=A0A2I0HKT0_PUNGR|nr:hypothetical protein CRG98_047276 [Punica granatum]